MTTTKSPTSIGAPTNGSSRTSYSSTSLIGTAWQQAEQSSSAERATYVGLRLFATCMIVFTLHFATNTVREIFPALSLGDKLSFDVTEYKGLHPDIFEMQGRGVFINNNPGASILGAVPYLALRPLVDSAVAAVQARRASELTNFSSYDSIYPMAREFYERSRERGFDIKFGIAAAIMQSLVMAPLSALSVVVMYWIMLGLTKSRRAAILTALLYGFATPVFYRTGQLNQNLLLAHFALFAFVLLWRPGVTPAGLKKPFYFLAGLCAGWTVVLDYSGLVAFAALSGYAVAIWRTSPRAERSTADLLRFASGVTICAAVLMSYQWSSFGNPILPAQSYMPPANFTDAGYRGMSLPQPDLLIATAFSPRYGLFTSAPFLLLAFFMPAWAASKSRLLQRRELIFVLTFIGAFFIFCAANQYGRMQFNSGVRHIVPVVPFVFLLAANVFLRMPKTAAGLAALFGTYWVWCLAMYRDVEQGFGILEAVKHITLEGFRLPWLTTIEKMGYVQSASAIPLLLLSGVVIWIIWTASGRKVVADA